MRSVFALVIISALSACTTVNKARELHETLPAYTAAQPLKVLWSVKTGAPGDRHSRYTLALSDKRIHLLGGGNRLIVLDQANGEILQRIPLGKILVTGGVGYGDGLALVGSAEGDVLALDVKTGETRWRSRVSSEVLSAPQLARGIAVVQTNDAGIYGIDARDGHRIWAYQGRVPPLMLQGTSRPVIYQDRVLAAFGNGDLICLDLQTGKVLWESPIGIPKGRTELERMVDIDAPLQVYNGIIYAVGYQSRLAAVDFTSGRLLWARDASSYAGFALDSKSIYLAMDDGRLLALDRYSGAVLWKQDKLAAIALARPLLLGSRLIVYDTTGYLFWLNPDTGELLASARMSQLPGRYNMHNAALLISPEVDKNILYLASRNGIITAMTPELSP